MKQSDYSNIFEFLQRLPEKNSHNESMSKVYNALYKWMLVNGCISLNSIRDFIDTASRANIAFGVEQLLPQFNLAMTCLNLKVNSDFQVVGAPFKYLDIDGTFKIGNYYVPHFSLHSFIDIETTSHVKNYPNCISFHDADENRVPDCLDGPLNNDDENRIIEILNALPFDKKDIHIGFLFDSNSSFLPNRSKFEKIIPRLRNLGYDVYGNDGDKFYITEFGWDDSWSSTITVLVDFESYESVIQKNIEYYLTFDNIFWESYMPGRLIYISVFNFSQEESNKRNNERDVNLVSLHNEWLRISHLPYFLFPIYTYYPKGFFGLSERDNQIQKFIWNFKDADNSEDISYQQDLQHAINVVKSVLLCTFGEDDCKKLTFICVPPASEDRYIKRYRTFSNLICSELGMKNGFASVIYESNSAPKHLGGSGSLSVKISPCVQNDKVIVFDDIYTTGRTLNGFCNKLAKNGAFVLGAIVLGITQHDKSFEANECNGYQGLYEMYSENIW